MRKVIFALLLLALLPVVPLAGTAEAVPSNIVISQVYGGGGNNNATYRHDFVELFNRGTSTVSLTGWSTGYAPPTSTNWSTATLTGSIAPGKYHLIKYASGGSVGAALPAHDATGPSNIARHSGKVRLHNGSSTVDFLGYGPDADDYEDEEALQALNHTQSVMRDADGCTDTDNNRDDFSVMPAAPRNATTPADPCGSVANPRDTAITLASTVSGTQITANGSISPSVAGAAMRVRFFRVNGDTLIEFADVKTYVDAASKFTASATRTGSGTCAIRARFTGDATHDPSEREMRYSC